MSYRIYVNHYQCLGNNECPKVLVEELKRQGCEMDVDHCFHDFEIKELQPIIEALEQYIFEVDDRIKKRHNGVGLGDYTEEFQRWKRGSFTLEVENMVECGYMFVSYNFLKAIEGDYEEDFDRDKDRLIYKIKEGHHVYMSGF